MANVSMGWPNVIDATTVSGGSWMPSLPLSNVQNRRISKVARSTDTALASTVLSIDIGASATAIGMLALVVHSLSVSAKVRVLGGNAADFVTPAYDSGWLDVWPSGMTPLALLEWEGDNFWLGTISPNSVAGYRAPFTHYLPSALTQRYWRIEIDDTDNSDGHIQIGRVFMGKVWSPKYNMRYGMSLGYSDASTSETSLTGEEFFDVRTRFRTHKFELGFLSKEEALTYVLDMQQQLGTSGEILISADRSDIENAPRMCFLGRMTAMTPVTAAFYSGWTTSFEIREIL